MVVDDLNLQFSASTFVWSRLLKYLPTQFLLCHYCCFGFTIDSVPLLPLLLLYVYGYPRIYQINLFYFVKISTVGIRHQTVLDPIQPMLISSFMSHASLASVKYASTFAS